MCCLGDKDMRSFSSRLFLHTHTPSLLESGVDSLGVPTGKERGQGWLHLSICDGHRCQAPRGPEGAESKGTVVSELSCGTLKEAEDDDEAGKWKKLRRR